MRCSRPTTLQRTRPRRTPGTEVTSLEGDGAGAGACGPEAVRVRWLDWDGRTLRWQVGLAAAVAIELRIDGVRFQTFAVTQTGSWQDFSCTLGLSPTGCAQLEFEIAVAGVS